MSWSVPEKLAFVVPRYGEEVLGGAETVVRQMAEKLVEAGKPVEVLTTCALDHHTWENSYAEGLEEIHGVPVRRFPTAHSSGKMHKSIGARIGAGAPTTLMDQELWLNDGFRSPGLYHYLSEEHHGFHTIILSPYMFWTTYACSQIAPSKNVLRPCLHDEPFAYLDIYQPQFRDCRGIIFNSQPEMDLAQRIFDLPTSTEIIGEGIDIPASADPERFRKDTGITEPFVIYAGRREWGKNVETLISYYTRYSRRNPNIKLVLLGKGEVSIPREAAGRIIDLGYVDQQTKYDAFAAASATCQPSLWESFSRLLMDSWLAETPVLAYGGSEVTAYHVRRSRGGFLFQDQQGFETALDLVLTHPRLSEQMGRAGRAYVLENYTWDKVIAHLIETIDKWAFERGRQ